MINASTPPVPSTRTKIPSAAGNSSSISDGPSSTSHTRKPRSSHPWMTLVHPGPWTQLPPAKAPVTPPATSWFKPKVPPRNPFGEVVDDTREETESTSQTKPSEENIPSNNADDDQQNDSPDAPAPVQGSSDTDDTTSRSDQKPASAEKPIPPKRQGSKGTQPAPALDSTQREESTGSSSPSGERRTADNANAPAANTVSSTEVTPGVFHFSGTVSGDPESEGVASGLGIPEWKGAGHCLGAAVGFQPDFKDVTSGVEVPDLGGLSNKLGVSDLAGAVSGVPSLAGVVSGVPSLAGVVSKVPSLAGVVSGVPSLAGVAGLPHLSDASGVDFPAVGIPDMADVGGFGALGLGAPDLSGAGNPFEDLPDLSDAAGRLGIPDNIGGENGMGALGDLAAAASGGLGEFAGKGGLSGLEVPDLAGALSGVSGESPVASDAAQTLLPLTKSVSVPAIFSALPQSPSTSSNDGLPEARESASFSKACKGNPFDGKPGMPKSKTFQTGTPPPKRSTAPLPPGYGFTPPPKRSTAPLPPGYGFPLITPPPKRSTAPLPPGYGFPLITPPPKRSTAPLPPGYGFPLIKRKVQTYSAVPVEDLEVEMDQLDKQVQTLDLRGMELEKRLRNSQKDEDEEKMLVDWLTLVREKNVLVRRDTELVYLTKQQHLEERQADVEYGLRCLLNKPESDWSQEDRGREQQLMDELVTIIDQRNLIISSLDQDRQSEREEDLLFETMMKRKDLQKEGLKELKKSRGKFKLNKVLKMLSQKSETAKDSKDKKKS